MKKINRCLLIALSITFYTINSNVAYCQTCNSSVQQIYLAEKVCVNNPSSLQLDISLNYYNSTDEYGWSDYGYQLSDVTVKRPDGTTAIVLSYGNLTFPSSDACYYIFPGGYFNVVGDWKFFYVQADLCSGDEYYNEVTLKVVGLTSNSIGSDEVICNVGGTPQNISNTSIGSNSVYTNKWQNKTGAGSWYDISGATSISYQPSYINQTTMYRRIVTTDELGCTDISNNVSKYVFASLTPGAIGSNQDVCYNVSPSIISETTAPTGGSSYPNYSYQWYISYDNTNWSAISGATAKNYQPSFTLGYTYFKRKTIDASCGEAYTNSVQLHGYNDLTPGSIGSDQLICYGATPSIISVTSIETGGIGSNSYQWYSSPDASNWSVASGSSTGQNYQPLALTTKTYYHKAIINSCRTAYTNSVTIDVRPPLSSGSIGNNQTVCYNDIPSLVATLINPSGASNSFTYAWESSPDNSSWSPIPGANLVSYQPPALPQTTYFRKKIIDANCPFVYSNTVTVTVRPLFSSGSIGTNQNICNGTTPVLLSNVADPSGGQGPYTYIWEISLNAIDWSIITGANSPTYQPGSLTITTYYRRKVTDATCGNGYNNTVTVTVKPVFSVGTIGTNQTICINTAPSLISSTASPSGGQGGYTYFWESSLNGTDFNNISGATGETYQPGVLSQTTYYRRHVTDASCGNGFSNTVKITVRSSFFSGAIGSDQTICYYQTPYFISSNVPASGGSGLYTYEWQRTENGTDWMTIPGATMNEYQPVNLAVTTKYRILVTDAICGNNGYTNYITVTVRPIFKAGNIGYSETICYGYSPAIIVSKVAPSGGSGSYTYEWSSGNNGINWNLIPSATGETYQPGILTQTTYFRRKVIDVCGSGYSLNDTVTVRPALVAGSISSNQSICYNTAPSRFTSLSLPSGATGVYTYQWQSSINNVSWSNISGATSEEFQPLPMISSLYFRRVETSGSCGTVQTNSIFITLNSQLVTGSIKSDETICYGHSPGTMITNTAPVGGTGAYSYQWQKLVGTVWTDISGATTETFTSNALTSNSYFRRTETSGSCGTVISNQIAKTVLQQFSGGIIGSSQTISYNTAPILLTSLQSPSGATLPYTFQWMKSEDNSYFVNVNGATSETYQPGNLVLNTYFKRVTSSSTCGSVETNTVTITVTNQLLPGIVTADQTICFKTAPNLLTGSSPSGGTGLFSFQWMKSFNNTDWFNIEGEVGSSIQPGILTENTYFRRGVTSGANSSFSNSVKVTVYQPLNIPITDAKSFYCKGTSFQLSILNPVYASYKWYDSSQNYLQDGTKINITNFSSDKKYYLKAVNSLGCFSDPVEIPLFVDNVHAGFTNDITIVTLGSAVKFTSTSVNASSYAWNFFEGDIINETNPVHYYNTLGVNSKKFSVKLIVTSPVGCLDSLLRDGIITVVNIVNGIESNKAVTFSYYPNPVTEKLCLSSNGNIKTVKVFNISGKMIESLIFDSESVFIDFSSLKSDIYILEINGLQDSKKNIKIIKK